MTNDEFQKLHSALLDETSISLTSCDLLRVLNAAEEIPSVKAAFAVVKAAAALIESGDWDCFDDAANARFIALESAVKVWRGAQTDKGEQGNG